MTQSAKQIRVLHIFGAMRRGGSQMRTLDIMRNLDRRSFRLDYCSLAGTPATLDDEIKSLGGEVYLCKLGLGFGGKFRRLLRENQYDVVHSHVGYSSGYILRLAAKEGVPVRVAHFRNTLDDQRAGARWQMQRRLMTRWIDLYATNILAVSEGAMSCSWRGGWQQDSRCQVIYNGLDLAGFGDWTNAAQESAAIRREFALPAASPLYMHIGRMYKDKNHTRIVSIFAEILRHVPHARLLLVGRPTDEIAPLVNKKIEQLGITSHVTLTGERADVPRLLRAADAMLFPSLREGLPGAVLEACAAGTPVLGSDLPGITEIAARFPSVKFLTLSEQDARWAQAAEKLRVEFAAPARREQVARSFARSIFSINCCVAAHCAVWRNEGKASSMVAAARPNDESQMSLHAQT